MDQPTIYALLAADAYQDIRPFKENQAPIPPGWKVLTEFDVATSGSKATNFGSAFSSRTFQGPNGEIVISYAGTEFPESITAGLTNDFISGNFPLAGGSYGKQAYDAALVYQKVQARFGASANISFTGHSLGGGLAGLMAVWFDRPATVFDPAPFELAGWELPPPLVMTPAYAVVMAALAVQGYHDAKFDNYRPLLDFSTRESRVVSYAIQGEILELLDYFLFPRIEASRTPKLVGAAPDLSGGDKHSIDLLAAVLLSTPFEKVVTALPNALPLLFEHSLYGPIALGTRQNLLTKLLRGEVGMYDELTGGQVIAPTGLLTKFTADLNKLAGSEGGMAAQEGFQKALIVVAMEYYYFKDAAAVSGLFTVSGNGIHFNYSDLGAHSAPLKSPDFLDRAIKTCFDSNTSDLLSIGILQGQTSWHIQSGTSGMVWSGGSDFVCDVAVGGIQADALSGGGGADLLIGGDGDDTLNGGAGTDVLVGGNGNDIYQFTGAFGSDTVLDSDGLGSIQVDGSALQGGKKIEGLEGVWRNQEQGYTFTLAGSGADRSLLIVKDNGLDAIRIKGWQDGQLGLTMDSASPPPLVAEHIYIGDQHGQLVDGRYDWLSTHWGADGSLAGGVVEEDYKDVILGSNDDDRISGLGGNDALYGGGGDDQIDGGAGDDLIGGGSGSDTIQGGAGADTVLSATGLNVYQRGGPDDAWSPSLAGNGGGVVMDDAPDVIDGGDGDDIVYAGSGSDSIQGGAGNDELWGLAGNDIIEGGAGEDQLIGDGINAAGSYASSPGEMHGSDFLDGGEGNDRLIGFGKNDVLYGGAGNDLMYGDGYAGAQTTRSTYLAAQYHGDDYLDGGDGDDYVEGNGGADTLYGGAGADILWGDAAADILSGEFHGDDYIDAGDGDDDVVGGGADDTLYGGAGNDRLRGDSSGAMPGEAGYLAGQYHGNDYLDGGDGDDQMSGDGGSDTLFGGSGKDILYGDETPDKLAAEFHGDDYLDGEDGDDKLYGNGGDDVLYGGKGNDLLVGGSGADYMDGGEGDDSYEAGAGDTIVDGGGINTLKLAEDGPYSVSVDGADLLLDYGTRGTLHVEEALTGSIASIDGVMLGDWLQGYLNEATSVQSTDAGQTLSGGRGDDQLTAYHSGAVLRGGYGNDLLTAWGSDARLSGGDGDDVLQVFGAANFLEGNEGDDRLTATAGDDALDGGSGNDTLSGGAGKDTLRGGAGDDVIDGGDGDDLIYAGSGLDTLRGGAGLDTYVLGYGMNQVTVEDSSPEGSVIQLDASGLQLDALTARRAHDDLVVEVRGTDTRMLVKDYYGASHAAWLFKDAQGNALSALVLADSSVPRWTDLQSSLVEAAQSDMRSRIGAQYASLGFARQVDGSWYIADAPRLLDNNSYEYLTTTTYTHQLMSDSSTTWETPPTSAAGVQWASNDGDWETYGSRSETVVAISYQSQAVSDEFVSPVSRSDSVSYQQVWRGVAWSVRSSEAGVTGSTRIQYVRSEPGSPPEIITEESSSTYLTRFYTGLDTGMTLEDPGAPGTAGSLPRYVSGVFSHFRRNYQLGPVTLSAGNHTVLADEYSVVIGGVGDNTIFGAGFAYGGTGNARLVGGGILMAGAGDQYLEGGQAMVVGDGHDTVLAKARWHWGWGSGGPFMDEPEATQILVDPNNSGIDLLLSDYQAGHDKSMWAGFDDVIECIYRAQGFNDVWQLQNSYLHGGKFLWAGQFFNSAAEAQNAFHDAGGEIWRDDLADYIKPLSVLLRNPDFDDAVGAWGPASDYYDAHPLQTVLLTANNFSALKPYLEAGLLPTKTVVFGPGLSLADIDFSWGVAVSPLDGASRATLKLQWGPDQGVQVMIPRADDVLDAAVQRFEFPDGSVAWLQDLIAMAPPVPAPDPQAGSFRTYAGTAGADVLTGTVDIDRLEGLAGDDTYIVNKAGDVVIENANGGVDTVNSSVDCILAANVENLTLTGAADLNGAGNALNNILTGNSGNNVLVGGFGADTLLGGEGDDVIDGPAPAAGASARLYMTSTTAGKYAVDDGFVAVFAFGDGAVPAVSAGQSLKVMGGGNPVKVYVTPGSSMDGSELIANGTSVHLSGKFSDYGQAIDQDTGVYTFTRISGLPVGQSESALVLVSDADVYLYFADGLIGLNGAADARLVDMDTFVFHPIQQDWLTGGAQAWPDDLALLSQGADQLVGGLGDDSYFVDDAGDAVVESAGEGTDTVQAGISYTLAANVENLTLIGTATLNGGGNALDNIIIGNIANNALDGGRGNDVLSGGAGNDTYSFGHGDGADTVQEDDSASGNVDVLQFVDGIRADQLWMRQLGNDLEISVVGTSDKVTVQNWYLGSQHHVEQIRADGGKVLLDTQLETLVLAMASYAPPATGQADLSAAYAAALAPVLGAAWH